MTTHLLESVDLPLPGRPLITTSTLLPRSRWCRQSDSPGSDVILLPMLLRLGELVEDLDTTLGTDLGLVS